MVRATGGTALTDDIAANGSTAPDANAEGRDANAEGRGSARPNADAARPNAPPGALCGRRPTIIPTMPIRILVVARWYPSHDVLGRGSFVADQVQALAGAGAQVVVVCPEPAYAVGLDGPGRDASMARIGKWASTIAAGLELAAPVGRGAPGVPVLRIPAPLPAGGQATRDPLTLAALEAASLIPVGTALHAAWPFDVIHAHTGLPDGLAAAALADALAAAPAGSPADASVDAPAGTRRVPVLTTEHDSATRGRLQDPGVAAAYRGLIGPDRALVAVSRALAGQIEEGLGLETGRIDVVPNVVPVELFQPDPDVDRDPHELLWVGTRKEDKGTDTLLRAFALLRRERPAIRLRLIGRPGSEAEEGRLVALARDLEIAEAVRFEPPADRAGVADAMRRAAVFVHPSPWETFGVVAGEALAVGLPVVATPSGGVEEIVGRDGRFGTIARDHAPASLAEAIAATLDRREAFDSAALRAGITRRFAPGVVADDLLARFRALGATPGPEGQEPATGGRIDLPIVVVGFRRASALARIPGLPPELAARIAVVTSAPTQSLTGKPPGEPTPGTAVIHWADVDADRDFRVRVAALGEAPARSFAKWRTLRHPLRAIRRRRLLAARAALFAAARRRAIGEAIAMARQATPSGPSSGGPTRSSATGPVMLLPLDIDDLEAIEPLLAAGRVILAPGTLGWLVDRWASPEP